MSRPSHLTPLIDRNGRSGDMSQGSNSPLWQRITSALGGGRRTPASGTHYSPMSHNDADHISAVSSDAESVETLEPDLAPRTRRQSLRASIETALSWRGGAASPAHGQRRASGTHIGNVIGKRLQQPGGNSGAFRRVGSDPHLERHAQAVQRIGHMHPDGGIGHPKSAFTVLCESGHMMNFHSFKDFSSDTACEAMQSEGGPLWIDLFHPSIADFQQLGEVFGLHPLTVEDCLSEDGRERVATYDAYTFLKLQGLPHNVLAAAERALGTYCGGDVPEEDVEAGLSPFQDDFVRISGSTEHLLGPSSTVGGRQQRNQVRTRAHSVAPAWDDDPFTDPLASVFDENGKASWGDTHADAEEDDGSRVQSLCVVVFSGMVLTTHLRPWSSFNRIFTESSRKWKMYGPRAEKPTLSNRLTVNSFPRFVVYAALWDMVTACERLITCAEIARESLSDTTMIHDFLSQNDGRPEKREDLLMRLSCCSRRSMLLYREAVRKRDIAAALKTHWGDADTLRLGHTGMLGHTIRPIDLLSSDANAGALPVAPEVAPTPGAAPVDESLWSPFLYFRGLHGHLGGMVKRVEAVLDEVRDSQSTYLALVDIAINKRMLDGSLQMKRLTQVASISAPMSLCVGLFGMNVEVPFGHSIEHRSLAPFFAIIGFLIVLIGSQMLILRSMRRKTKRSRLS